MQLKINIFQVVKTEYQYQLNKSNFQITGIILIYSNNFLQEVPWLYFS